VLPIQCCGLSGPAQRASALTEELISTNYQYLDEGADFIIIVNSKNKEAAI